MSRTMLLIVAGCSLVGCTLQKPVEKSYPSGDLYEDKRIRHAADGYDDPGATPPRPGVLLPNSKQEDRGLRLVIKPESPTVKGGTPITVQMAVRNTTGATMPVIYASEKRFDLLLFSDAEQRNLVHQWTANRLFAQLFSDQMLGAGSSVARILEIPTTADPRVRELAGDDASSPVAPGTYYLWGTHEGQPFLAYGPIEIIVEP